MGLEAGGAAGVALAAMRAEPVLTSPATAVVLAADGGAGGGRGCARPHRRPWRLHQALDATLQARARAVLSRHNSAVLG